MGTNKCPFDLQYEEWGYLAPLAWIKMLLKTLQVTEFQVHLKYSKLPLPRRGDVVVMEYAMSMRLDKEDLLSMSRVKGKLGIISLSDMTTANGKHLERFAIDPQEQICHRASLYSQEKLQQTKTGRYGKILATAHSRKLPAAHTPGSLDFHHTQKMELVL